jgi:molybdenum cofactor cytidylyltransferase
MIDAIVLAAGQSARLGRAKQLLPYAGATLLAQAIASVRGAAPRRLLVVLGSGAARIRGSSIGGRGDIVLVDNPDWPAGPGTSIRAGVAALAGLPPAAGVLLAVCDQPLVPAAHFSKLRELFLGAPDHVVASSYAGTVGVPAIFPRDHLGQLRALPAGAGAKSVIERSRARALHVACPEAATDIDTEADYDRLLARGR